MKHKLCVVLTAWLIGMTGVVGLRAEPIIAVPLAEAKTTNGQPSLQIDKAQRIVEATASGQNIEEVFTLPNTGNQPLDLEVERASCGCVGATLSAKTLKPRQRATLTFKIQASGWGSKTESVTLKTNDPAQPHATLTVQAKMPPTVVPNPSQLSFETVEGEATQRFISLLLPEGASLESVRARQPFVSTQVKESQPITGGSMQRIAVSITASAPPGAFKDELTLRLKNAPVPQIGVPVEGDVKEDIQADPSQIFLGQIAVGSTKRKTFLVQSHSGKVFQIRAIQSSSPRVTVQASPMVTAASHAVEVSVQANDKVGFVLQETIRLTLSSGRVLETPIVGKVTPATAVASKSSDLKIGSLAPDFTIMDMNGNPWKLSDLRDKKNLLLTFFPKCFTGGCAGQMASLQAHLKEFEAADLQILAVSVDSAEEQSAFAAKLGLQFPLIPDTKRELCLLYGAAQDKTDLAARQSVLIDKDGIMRWLDRNVNVSTHGTDVLAKMRELRMAK